LKKNIITFVFLIQFLIFGSSVQAAVGPASGTTIINSIVYGPAPTVAPTIDQPASGASFDSNLVSVGGTCLANLQVKVFKNNIFAGSTLCSASSTYEMQISLFEGKNDLIARIYDNLDQPGPDSNLVSIYYYPLVAPTQSIAQKQQQTSTQNSQFIISYDYSVNTAYEKKSFKLPFQIIGGVGSYAVAIDWGDGTSDVYQFDQAGNYAPEHIYKKSGNYIIKINGTDKSNQKAYLQTLVFVSGAISITAKILSPLSECKPDVLWPLATASLALLLTALITYALAKHHGEMLELKKLREEHLLKKSNKK
jgi:hypothetical protein